MYEIKSLGSGNNNTDEYMPYSIIQRTVGVCKILNRTSSTFVFVILTALFNPANIRYTMAPVTIQKMSAFRKLPQYPHSSGKGM